MIGLYSDGSFFILELLINKKFNYQYIDRIFSEFITQIPILIFLKTGINDINFLLFIHSFGLVGIQLFIWILALLNQKNEKLFWFFTTAFSLNYLIVGFYAIHEINFSIALSALSASILLKNNKENNFQYTILLISAILNLNSYPFSAFTSIFLFFVCLIKIISKIKNKQKI